MKAKSCTFRNTVVQLDGHSFRRCRFAHCRLVYAGGDLPQMIDCTFEGCRWSFEGAAGRTLRLMQAMVERGGMRAVVEHSLGLAAASPAKPATQGGTERRPPGRNLH